MLKVKYERRVRKTIGYGKFQNPHYFKNMDISQLPVIWKFNKKSWMNHGAMSAVFYCRNVTRE